MQKRLVFSILSLLSVIIATLAAIIYVSATQSSDNRVLPVAHAYDAPLVAQAPTVTPGAIFGPILTVPSGELVVTSQPPSPSPTLPSGAPFGPIVSPNHTLEPTIAPPSPALSPPPEPTAGPSPTPGPGLSGNMMGIQIHPHIDSREFGHTLNYAKELGVTWVKYQYNWSLLESAPGQFTELFYMLRLYVQQTHSQGFKVMISVAKAPGWSRSADADGTLRENGPPDDPQTLANFISGMLNKIGRDGNGVPYISAVEVWNEPNLQREWYGYPMTGENYMRYFRPAYDAVRQFSPNIVVITGAPAPTGDSEVSTNDRLWLQGLYNAGLAQYGQDVAIGIHPYGWANSPDERCCANPSQGWDEFPQFYFLETLEEYHTIMVNNGHANAQMWTTEFGWATFDGLRTNGGNGSRPPDPPGQAFYSYINAQQQAEYTLRAFYIGQERDYMGPMILWNLNFATIAGAVDQSNPQAGYGILDSAWQPRPVYSALKNAPKS